MNTIFRIGLAIAAFVTFACIGASYVVFSTSAPFKAMIESLRTPESTLQYAGLDGSLASGFHLQDFQWENSLLSIKAASITLHYDGLPSISKESVAISEWICSHCSIHFKKTSLLTGMLGILKARPTNSQSAGDTVRRILQVAQLQFSNSNLSWAPDEKAAISSFRQEGKYKSELFEIKNLTADFASSTLVSADQLRLMIDAVSLDGRSVQVDFSKGSISSVEDIRVSLAKESVPTIAAKKPWEFFVKADIKEGFQGLLDVRLWDGAASLQLRFPEMAGPLKVSNLDVGNSVDQALPLQALSYESDFRLADWKSLSVRNLSFKWGSRLFKVVDLPAAATSVPPPNASAPTADPANAALDVAAAASAAAPLITVADEKGEYEFQFDSTLQSWPPRSVTIRKSIGENLLDTISLLTHDKKYSAQSPELQKTIEEQSKSAVYKENPGTAYAGTASPPAPAPAPASAPPAPAPVPSVAPADPKLAAAVPATKDVAPTAAPPKAASPKSAKGASRSPASPKKGKKLSPRRKTRKTSLGDNLQ